MQNRFTTEDVVTANSFSEEELRKLYESIGLSYMPPANSSTSNMLEETSSQPFSKAVFRYQNNIFNKPSLKPSTTISQNIQLPPGNYEAAPFEKEDIQPILQILQSCPEKKYNTRVFQQHQAFGTCWYDSFWMMFFENKKIKQFIRPYLRKALETLLQYKDLSYTTQNNIQEKTNLLAQVLKTPVTHAENRSWQIFTHSLQKYLLLGYLIHLENKEFDEDYETNTNTNNNSSPIQRKKYQSLLNRRVSINTHGFETIHSCLRTSSYIQGYGAFPEYIEESFIKSLQPIVQEITDDIFSVTRWSNREDDTKIAGYYCIIEQKSKNKRRAHVISIFKCSKWVIYNNEYGIIPLTAEQSKLVDMYTIDSVKIVYNEQKGYVEYLITLGNSTLLHIASIYENDSTIDYTLFKKEESWILVDRTPRKIKNKYTRSKQKKVIRRLLGKNYTKKLRKSNRSK